MVNVVVGRKRTINVSGEQTGQLISPKAITLKNDLGLTSVTSSANRLDHLADVSEPNNPSDGSTLVYDSGTDTYFVRQMDLDGGDF